MNKKFTRFYQIYIITKYYQSHRERNIVHCLLKKAFQVGNQTAQSRKKLFPFSSPHLQIAFISPNILLVFQDKT